MFALWPILGEGDHGILHRLLVVVAGCLHEGDGDGSTAWWYFTDDRAYSAVVQLLGSPDVLTRLWAARALFEVPCCSATPAAELGR